MNIEKMLFNNVHIILRGPNFSKCKMMLMACCWCCNMRENLFHLQSFQSPDNHLQRTGRCGLSPVSHSSVSVRVFPPSQQVTGFLVNTVNTCTFKACERCVSVDLLVRPDEVMTHGFFKLPHAKRKPKIDTSKRIRIRQLLFKCLSLRHWFHC